MASSATLMLSVGFSAGAAIAGLGSVEKRIERLGAAVKKVGADSDLGAAMGRNIASLKRSAALGEALKEQRARLREDAVASVATLGALAVPVKLAIDFESAMADVKKVVDFESPEGFKALGRELQALSLKLPLAATDLAKIAASGGQLGVAAKDLPKFTETIAKMSTAFDMLPEEAGDSMAKLANIFKIPIANISVLGDAINQLSNESPAKARDIVQALGRVGGVGKQFGMTELQLASLTNAFISLGKPPEVAGTAINGMLTKLMTADKQGAKFQSSLSKLGYTASGLKDAIGKDAQGALMDFLKSLEKMPQAERMGALVDLFGLEYADDVAVLAGSVDAYSKSIETLNGQGFKGSMDKEFAARAATTAAQLTLLKNGLVDIGMAVGETVLPALNDLISDFRPILSSAGAWVRANQGLVGGLVKTVAVLAAFKFGMMAAMFAGNMLFSGLVSVWKGVTMLRGGWMLLQASLRVGLLAPLLPILRGVGQAVLFIGRALLMNPIGLTITGIAVAGYLVYKHWGTIGPVLAKVWNTVKSAFTSAWAWIRNLPSQFMRLGADVLNGLINGIKSRFNAVKDSIIAIGSSIKSTFTNALGIKSPSRVFMEFGGHIAAGAAIGITKGGAGVASASDRLARAAKSALRGGAMAAGLSAGAGAFAAGGAGGSMNITFAPVIHVNGGAGGGAGVQAQVQAAMQTSFAEFERMMRRYEQERSRKAF